MNNDLISRSALLSTIRPDDDADAECAVLMLHVKKLFRNAITNAPAVDAVVVVRCKDCKYRHDSCFAGNGNTYCDKKRTYFPLDGFCSYGERRVNDGK